MAVPLSVHMLRILIKFTGEFLFTSMNVLLFDVLQLTRASQTKTEQERNMFKNTITGSCRSLNMVTMNDNILHAAYTTIYTSTRAIRAMYVQCALCIRHRMIYYTMTGDAAFMSVTVYTKKHMQHFLSLFFK